MALAIVPVIAAAFCAAPVALAGLPASKGISYGPDPRKAMGIEIHQDDFFSDEAKPLWGPRGRGDLAVIKALGANTVRLYGNNPENRHKAFLDEANTQGLTVTIGMSDYPYTQSKDRCRETEFDCYAQLKGAYAQNLANGFLVKQDGVNHYHPALGTIIVINEPDLKLPGMNEPKKWTKGIISAIDGMLDAEKEAGVQGSLINFTATFSFGVCGQCPEFSSKPALGQMMALREGLLDPEGYCGYTPKNDLLTFFKTRFKNSFNTANPAQEIPTLFLDDYTERFPTTPVTIEEYHKPGIAQEEDLKKILEIANESALLQGISFFEYQVRYDKGGSEMEFGMFGLGDYDIQNFSYFGGDFKVWCLTFAESHPTEAAGSIPAAVKNAFGGVGLDEQWLCKPDPAKVPLDEAHYREILLQNDPARMATFVGRLVTHLGGTVVEESGLTEFTNSYCFTGTDKSWEGMMGLLGAKPPWAVWDPDATCVSDALSDYQSIGQGITYACTHLNSFNCTYIPDSCKDDPMDTASYVFSVYYNEVGKDPMESCYFNGAAVYAGGPLLKKAASGGCVVTKDPALTALTEEGYQVVKAQNEPARTKAFIERVVKEDMKAEIGDTNALDAMAADPPATYPELKTKLVAADWVCGGSSGKECPMPPTPTPGKEGVFALLRMEVTGVNFPKVTEGQEAGLMTAIVALLEKVTSIPATSIMDLADKPNALSFSAGSLIIDSKMELSAEDTAEGLKDKLDTSEFRQQLLDTVSSQLSGDAITPPLAVRDITVDGVTITTTTTTTEGSSGWPWWVWLLGLLALLCLCGIVAAVVMLMCGSKKGAKSKRGKAARKLTAPSPQRWRGEAQESSVPLVQVAQPAMQMTAVPTSVVLSPPGSIVYTQPQPVQLVPQVAAQQPGLTPPVLSPPMMRPMGAQGSVYQQGSYR